jgi:DNA-binding transcriptional MerR regulator
MAGYFRSQLANAAGVSGETLRYYEKMGLVQPKRSENGYRVYPEGTVERLAFIKRAKEAGFTLDEIRKTLALFDYSLNFDQLSAVMAEGIAAKIAEIDVRIGRLAEVRALLAEIHEALRQGRVCPVLGPMLKRSE